MSEDILADWKTNKFIVAPAELSDCGHVLIVLTDIKYWAKHADELAIWCEENYMETKGMTVTMDSPDKLMLFLLRWT